MGSLSNGISHLRDLTPTTLHIWDLHPTPYHAVSIPLHCISGSLSHITPHPRVFTSFISRDLYLDAYLTYLHPLHHCIHQTQPTLHHIHDPSSAPRPSRFTFLLGARAWTPVSTQSFLLGLPRPHQGF